jgi:hypothetical protein
MQDLRPPLDQMTSNVGQETDPAEPTLGKDRQRHPRLAQSVSEQAFVQQNDIDVDIVRPLQSQRQIVQLILRTGPEITRGEMCHPHDRHALD